MKWNKDTFKITTINNSQEEVSGIISYIKEFPIGIHKRDKLWIITDISTGCRIKSTKTQKEAKEFVESKQDYLLNLFHTPKHKAVARRLDEKM